MEVYEIGVLNSLYGENLYDDLIYFYLKGIWEEDKLIY